MGLKEAVGVACYSSIGHLVLMTVLPYLQSLRAAVAHWRYWVLPQTLGVQCSYSMIFLEVT